MPPQADNSEQYPCCIFTEEEAGRLVFEAMDTSPDEPEPFVRLLLILLDNAQEPQLQDSIYLLIKMAYNGSLVHSKDLDSYMEAIRQGHDPMEEIRARWCDCQKSDV